MSVLFWKKYLSTGIYFDALLNSAAFLLVRVFYIS